MWLVASVALVLPAGAAAAGPKTAITFPADPYAVPGTNDGPGWVKFTIRTADPDTVLFQDSQAYPFHYDFALAELAEFAGMSPAEFDAATLYASGQQAILGAVILPPLRGGVNVFHEYGIQLVRRDPYPPEQVVELFELVRSRVLAEPPPQALYFPAFEQQASAEEHRDYFAAHGLEVASPDRWAEGNGCYATGWALGRVKFFPATQIEAAWLAGQLEPVDILLTDGVPAEIPFLAGVLSETASSPGSHVSILAQTFGLPFAHLAVPADLERAQALVGRRVALRVERDAGAISVDAGCRVKLIDVEDKLDEATVAAILELKRPPPPAIAAMQPFGAYGAPTDGLELADIEHFGGKAANFGPLRRALPDDSPVALAFSFDLWNGFLDQGYGGAGGTLREEIAARLAGFDWPPDMAELAAALDGIRDAIRDPQQTDFPPALAAAVLAALQEPQYGFDPELKLRFRSSTNAEDGEQLIGAGLYDSYSGCLADDLDGDAVGPSRCDASVDDERGVLRAIRRVFASFYNTNAFVDRLRHGVDESQVGMAVLVHHSFPDEYELANGVATLTQRTPTNRRGYVVSQTGAHSVTNPEPGAVPEEVDVWISQHLGYWPTLLQASNLVPLGATVLEFPDEYAALTELLERVADEYGVASGSTAFTLEFEFKKEAPGGTLSVKQVRKVPEADVSEVTPFLINEPAEYCLFQGEYGTVFANHRLKARLALATGNLWLNERNLQQSFYADTTMGYAEACQLYEQTGPLPQWPKPSHGYDAGTEVATDGWGFVSLQNPRGYTLVTRHVPTRVPASAVPLLVLTDFGDDYLYTGLGCLELVVDYELEVPTLDWSGPTTTKTEQAVFCPCPSEEPGDLLQRRELVGEGDVSIVTEFYWPPPVDVAAGYTAPAVRFVETTIAGLTSSPVVLQGEYSQTYRPEHHNFAENFLFEPALEPDLPAGQLAELVAAGVRAIHVQHGFGPTAQITYYDDALWGGGCLDCTGFDGDGDGYCTAEPTFDCDDADPQVWATPGEVEALRFAGPFELAWDEPVEIGGSLTRYDLLRAESPTDHGIAGVCVEADDGADRVAEDFDEPAPGGVFYYLVRAENACPDGAGSLGARSDGTERTGRDCP